MDYMKKLWAGINTYNFLIGYVHATPIENGRLHPAASYRAMAERAMDELNRDLVLHGKKPKHLFFGYQGHLGILEWPTQFEKEGE